MIHVHDCGDSGLQTIHERKEECGQQNLRKRVIEEPNQLGLWCFPSRVSLMSLIRESGRI